MAERTRSNQERLSEDGGYTTKTPKNRTIFKVVICLFVAGAIAFMIATIALAVEKNKRASEADSCTSEQCIKSAAMYLDSMDQTIDPCHNFYEYACGGWTKKRLVPEDKKHYNQLTLLNDDLSIKLKELLERAPQDNEPATYKEARNQYSACIDIGSINRAQEMPLIHMLNSIGGWPVLGDNPGGNLGGNWNSSGFDFESLWIALARKYDTLPIISIFVGVDEKASTHHVLKVQQSRFVVPEFEKRLRNSDPVVSLIDDNPYPEDFGRQMLLGEGKEYSKPRQAYLQYMVDIVMALGVNETTGRNEMTKVIEFEADIEKFKVSPADLRNPNISYNPTTIEGLGQVYPELDWARLIQSIMPPSVDPPVTKNERIINKAPDYLMNVTKFMKSIDDQRVIANYMIWQHVSKVLIDLGPPFSDIRQKYLNAVRGPSAEPARWKRCVGETNDVLALVTGRMFVDKYFPGNAKEKTLAMINDLLKAFKSMLSDNDWLQEADKKEAIAKADNIRIDVGFPDWTRDNAKLDSKYAGVFVFQNNTYFNNSLSYYGWTGQTDLSWLRKPVEKDVRQTGAAQANAFFRPSLNSIEFPAGILQPPFYHQDLPWYSNYGGIGVVIGHEITHGFDNNGRKYDKDGNVRTWWSQQSIDDFNERARCMAEQYSKFEMPHNGRRLNGNQTLGENIADNGGLKESFKAYKDNIPKQPRLPGLDFTDDQMFFLSFGNVFCSLYTPKGADSAIDYGQHSPGRYRVIGSLQNNEDFTAAYNCPVGSYMNPTKKCHVW